MIWAPIGAVLAVFLSDSMLVAPLLAHRFDMCREVHTVGCCCSIFLHAIKCIVAMIQGRQGN